jgi:hypothetical protein
VLALPDVPRWIEAHGIAADEASWRRELEGGFAVGHDGARLIVAAGEADAAGVAALAREHATHTLLFAIEREDLAAALGERRIARAILHTLPDPSALPELDGASPLGEASLAHVPAPLAAELAMTRNTIWSAWVDGEPAAFAYAPWRSARWFDVSVDTLTGARQLGLATIVATAMIRDERAAGREPVWGADEDNLASLRLARRLGFEPVDEIWVAAARA